MLGDFLLGLVSAGIRIGAGGVLIHDILQGSVTDGVKSLLKLEAEIDKDGGESREDFDRMLDSLQNTDFSDPEIKRKSREISYRFAHAMNEFRKLLRAYERGEAEPSYLVKRIRREDRETFVDVAAAVYAHAECDDELYSTPSRELSEYVDDEMERFFH